jgi:hypothetical protein
MEGVNQWVHIVLSSRRKPAHGAELRLRLRVCCPGCAFRFHLHLHHLVPNLLGATSDHPAILRNPFSKEPVATLLSVCHLHDDEPEPRYVPPRSRARYRSSLLAAQLKFCLISPSATYLASILLWSQILYPFPCSDTLR